MVRPAAARNASSRGGSQPAGGRRHGVAREPEVTSGALAPTFEGEFGFELLHALPFVPTAATATSRLGEV